MAQNKHTSLRSSCAFGPQRRLNRGKSSLGASKGETKAKEHSWVCKRKTTECNQAQQATFVALPSMFLCFTVNKLQASGKHDLVVFLLRVGVSPTPETPSQSKRSQPKLKELEASHFLAATRSDVSLFSRGSGAPLARLALPGGPAQAVELLHWEAARARASRQLQNPCGGRRGGGKE